LRKVLPAEDGDKRLGSLKHLEKALAARVDDDDARRIMSALFGIYELRLGDAHLPTRKIEDAYRLADVDTSLIPIQQGEALIYAAARSIATIAHVARGPNPGSRHSGEMERPKVAGACE